MIADSFPHHSTSQKYARTYCSIHTPPRFFQKSAGPPARMTVKPAARRIALCLTFALLLASKSALASTLIQDVNTDLSHYSPGVLATIYVDLNNTTGASQSGNVVINIKHLGILTASLPTQPFSLSNGATTTLVYTWVAPSTNYTGYSVEVDAKNSGGSPSDSLNSAIDVSSSWTKFPRYGYVADYPSSLNSSDATHDMWLLKNYHIDGVQFYDWQWKHHVSFGWQRLHSGSLLGKYQRHYKLCLGSKRLHRRCPLLWDVNDELQPHVWRLRRLWAGSGVDYNWGLWEQNNGTNQWNISMPQGWATSALYI